MSFPHFPKLLSPRVRVEGSTPWLIRGGSTAFHLVHVEFPVEGLPAGMEGFRFLQVTDLHLRGYWPGMLDVALGAALATKPQMVLFTGDFVDDKIHPEPAYPFVRRFLDSVPTPLGTFAITGNHDGRFFLRRFEHSGTQFMDHSRAVIPVGEGAIELIGLSGPTRSHVTKLGLERIPERPANSIRIVMDHYPDEIRKVEPVLKPDLYLAGHTHGGQICLPGGRAIISHDALPRRYVAGLHRWGDAWMNVSRGLGFSHWEVRMFCPPEVHVFTLVRA